MIYSVWYSNVLPPTFFPSWWYCFFSLFLFIFLPISYVMLVLKADVSRIWTCLLVAQSDWRISCNALCGLWTVTTLCNESCSPPTRSCLVLSGIRTGKTLQNAIYFIYIYFFFFSLPSIVWFHPFYFLRHLPFLFLFRIVGRENFS